jgi:uncharacterized metal-binding protein
MNMKCHLCEEKPCSKGRPCLKKDSKPLYKDPEEAKIFKVAAEVEALYYCEQFEMPLRPWIGKVTCNPAEQARVLEEEGCQLLVVMGLCVGHDSIFYRHAKAPVTTLLVKDRKLGHNPAAAIYCRYIRNNLNYNPKERRQEEEEA